VANVTEAGNCPDGFLPANTPFSSFKQNVGGKSIYVECLKIKVSCCFLSKGGVHALLSWRSSLAMHMFWLAMAR
jgi:hypothetical protein